MLWTIGALTQNLKIRLQFIRTTLQDGREYSPVRGKVPSHPSSLTNKNDKHTSIHVKTSDP